MKARIRSISIVMFTLAAFCVCFFGRSIIFAQETGGGGDLSVTYAAEDMPLAGQEAALYQAAVLDANGNYVFHAGFDKAAKQIQKALLSDDWNVLCPVLEGCIDSENIQPVQVKFTDASGTVSFENLAPGLYMVQSLNTSLNSSIYRFDAFILAASAAEDGSSQTLQALPKAAVQDRDAEPVPYTVTKLWKGDASHPASVDIDIYRDGNLFETVTLSSANNWTYSWTDDGASRWSVMEKAIPENYDLELTRNGQNYLVTNTYDTVTDEPKEESPNTPSSNDKNPGGNKSGGSKTGLTEHENEFIVLAGAAGLILLVLGLRMKKTKQ